MTEDQLNRACGVAPNDMPDLQKAADEARARVSGYSKEKRKELLEAAKKTVRGPEEGMDEIALLELIESLRYQLTEAQMATDFANVACDMKDKRIVELEGEVDALKRRVAVLQVEIDLLYQN